MPSAVPDSNSSPLASARIVVVCLSASSNRVREIIDRHAIRGWNEEGSIRLLQIERRGDARENSRAIRRVVPPGNAVWIIVLERILHDERIETSEGGTLECAARQLRPIVELNSVDRFSEVLLKVSRQCGLDWHTQTAARLAVWIHEDITPTHVEAWLVQFERMRELWLGERLLRGLDFWSPSRLRDATKLDTELASRFDCLCLNTVRQGKSASFLANLFAKAIHAKSPGFLIEDFRTLFADPARLAAHRRVLFIEDCLLTGTEMTNFLSALLGLSHPKGRKWKYQPLPDPACLKQTEVELRFAVATDVGKWRLESFLANHGLTNMRIQVEAEGFRPILSADGRAALEAGLLYEDDPVLNNCIRDSERNIMRAALVGPWKHTVQLERASEFLRGIGDQLFRGYLLRAKYEKWDERKIEPCAFGMHGFGMMLAFVHSVPKASLPLFWMDGPVSFAGGIIQWKPLFPNAAF